MSRGNGDNDKHGIRIPGVMLDRIKREDGEEEDSRFQPTSSHNGKKRKQGPTLSRKEKRKQERESKKQKRSQGKQKSLVTPTKGRGSAEVLNKKTLVKKTSVTTSGKKSVKFEDEDHEDNHEEDPLAQLAKLKTKKNANGIRVVKQSELDVEDFEVDSEDFGDDFDEDFDDSFNDGDDASDPLTALANLKGKKSSAEVRIVKEGDISDNSSKDGVEDSMDGFDDEYDNTSDPLALLAAMKKGKKSSSEDVRVVKEEDLDDDSLDEDDSVNSDSMDDKEGDSDFEGFGSNDETEANPLEQLKKLKEQKNTKPKKQDAVKFEITPDQRELMRRDEDDMEYYAKKLGLKKGKKDTLKKIDDDDILGGLLDGLDFDYLEYDEAEDEQKEQDELLDEEDELLDDDDDDDTRRVKENPYVAPSQDGNSAETDEDGSSARSRYIPPALRRKMALEGQGDSEEVIQLKKAIKGPLNKLSEANLANVIGDINALYLSNPRQTVNEILTAAILDSIILQSRLLDMFVYLQAALIASITKLQGVDFGAYFIQTIVEKYDLTKTDSSKTKETLNLISLLSSVFMFQVILSRLLYDIIKELIEQLDERNAELLLKILRVAGTQMRSDDPTALKEIILLINKKQALMNDDISTRTSFLLETITNLKNNKLRTDDNTIKLISRIKKTISSLGHDSDPIQVNVDDIRNVDSRGKWWLVGSAWKGHVNDNVAAKDDTNINETAINDALDSAEPNWMELARSQRMNTDIRRAIFISIMSANDFVDAMTKLDKLGLKRAQEREIPRVLVHCTGLEPAWNPYYGILASKLCDSHSYRKTFQFMLWDVIKEYDTSHGGNNSDNEDEDFLGFDYSEDDEDIKLRRILNLGRFFGFLFARGSLSLHVLRTVNYLTLSGDSLLFHEVLMVSFLDNVAKMSQINSVGSGIGKMSSSSDQRYSDATLIDRLLKAKEQPALLRGLQRFLETKVVKSDVINGKKQKKRIEWGVRALTDIIDELLRHSKDNF
ncbi:suppressor of glycerol defect [Scheffersomyces spartinae]|uniref:Suppressor of glycerol defect n=1 Tax=Scheffersomyces spartinae TaxID=45513 RepID=A0A9P7V7D1_9ASCO|nr:suppressor of glycerol defect [Scheffersomyces spartinae]KAG7192728.1 suppressor of glycerol defect [Scheffersomyces spartinae]